MQIYCDDLDLDPQIVTYFLYLLAKISYLLLQRLRDEENVVKELGFEEKKWGIYKKSQQYRDFLQSVNGDLTVCGKFMHQRRKEIIDMLSEDPSHITKAFQLKNDHLIEVLSENHENLKDLKKKFDWTLEKIVREVGKKLECLYELLKMNEDENAKDQIILAEDLMILFAIKKYFKWEEKKDLNFNKFIEDRQYLENEVLMERIFEGYEYFKYETK